MRTFTRQMVLSALAAVTTEAPPPGTVLESHTLLDIAEHLAAQFDFPNWDRLVRIVRAQLGRIYIINRLYRN
jgi:hypothetical protein